MNKFQNVPGEFSAKFWENAMRAAQWSKEIGVLKQHPEPDRLFVCGLLHNIGELLLLQHFPAMYHKIEEQVSSGVSRVDAQRAVLGGTTADMAAFLFNIWKMPAEMIQSTMFHNSDLTLLTKTPNLSEEVLIIHMAATIVKIDPTLDAIESREQAVSIGNRYRDPLKLGLNFSMNNLLDKVEAGIGELIASGCAV